MKKKKKIIVFTRKILTFWDFDYSGLQSNDRDAFSKSSSSIIIVLYLQSRSEETDKSLVYKVLVRREFLQTDVNKQSLVVVLKTTVELW